VNASEPRPVRYRVELFGLLIRAGQPDGTKARFLDLSETGAFVERVPALDELQAGDAVAVTLAFPGSGEWTAKAAVCRLGTSRLELKRAKAAHVTVVREGFGLEFQELTDESLEQLREFLERLDSA
jgi:hypothetical protein